MNNLNQLIQQLAAIWKQLGINQRISIVLTALGVLAGLGSLVYLSSRTDYALLYGKLEESEAAKVIAALDDAKVPYKIKSGGTITVPADKVYLMRMQMAAKGIPRSGDGVGFEIFDKPNFGISDFVQRANYTRALQGELARTIKNVDMIEDARVMIVQPENRLLVDSQQRPTASVFVRMRGNNPLSQQQVNAIRFLVANSVVGLQPNYVSVVDNLGNVLSENNSDDSLVGMTTSQLAARKNMEIYLTKKAETMLDKVLGPGQSVVRVSAELNFDTSTRTEEKFDPEGAVVRTQTINDETVETVNMTPPGGAPGVQTNAPSGETNAVASATPSNRNTTHKKVANNQYEINKMTSNFTQSAGAVKKITAAVFVKQTTNQIDTARLGEGIANVLGIEYNTNDVRVVAMPFNDQPSAELIQKMDKEEARQVWWTLGKGAIYPLLTVVILIIFWRMLRKTSTESITLGVPVGPGAEANGAKEPVISVDALNQLIRENPNNMTQAIRSWMSNGPKN